MKYLTENKVDELRRKINSRFVNYEPSMSVGTFQDQIENEIESWFDKFDRVCWVFIGSQQFVFDYTRISFEIEKTDPVEWVLSLGSLKIYSEKVFR